MFTLSHTHHPHTVCAAVSAIEGVQRLAQGHSGTRTAGDGTTDPLVSGQPTLSPAATAALICFVLSTKKQMLFLCCSLSKLFVLQKITFRKRCRTHTHTHWKLISHSLIYNVIILKIIHFEKWRYGID